MSFFWVIRVPVSMALSWTRFPLGYRDPSTELLPPKSRRKRASDTNNRPSIQNNTGKVNVMGGNELKILLMSAFPEGIGDGK